MKTWDKAIYALKKQIKKKSSVYNWTIDCICVSCKTICRKVSLQSVTVNIETVHDWILFKQTKTSQLNQQIGFV